MDDGETSNLETVIDRILVSARDLKKKLETAREYSQDKATDIKPSIFIDNQRMKELERENIELRQALEDHQYGLEFIMSKYRSQVDELIKLNKVEKKVSPISSVCLKRNDSID